MVARAFGTIVLVPFPFTDQSAVKRRPAVIVSSAAYHLARPDLIVMPITSRLRPGAFGDLLVQDWEEAGLLMPSTVKPVLSTFDQGLVIKTLGSLTPRDRLALQGLMSQLVG